MRQPSLTTSLPLALLTCLVLQIPAQNVQTNPPGNQTVVQPITPAVTSLGVNVLNGLGYATTFITTSDTGITNAFQDALATVVAEPTYPSTVPYGDRRPVALAAQPAHLIDLRHSMVTDIFANWDSSYQNVYTATAHQEAAHVTNCYLSYIRNPLSSIGGQCNLSALAVTAPGWSLGPAPYDNPPPNVYGWFAGSAQQANVFSLSSGIYDGVNSSTVHTAPGDTINYFYTYSNNGSTAAGDEGEKALAAYTQERHNTYTGTVTAQSGNVFTTTAITDGGLQGQGQYVINATGTGLNHTAGNITAIAPAPFTNTNLTNVTVDQTVTPSTAWGTLVANVAPVISAGSTPNPALTIQVKLIYPASGPGFDTTGLVCVSSSFHDCAVPTNVTGPDSSGNITLTIPLRRPHTAGGLVMQGGVTGSGIELEATRVKPSDTSSTLRYLQDVFGATDPHTLVVGLFETGSLTPFRQGPIVLPTITLSNFMPSANLAYPNGIVANVDPGSFFYYTSYAGATFTIANPGSSAIACSNALFGSNASGATLTCTPASPIPAGAGARTAGLNNAQYDLWAMAEVLDVRNPSTAANDAVDGTFTLEPAILTFGACPGTCDTLEETHSASSIYSSFSANLDVSNPLGNMFGATFAYQGAGLQAPQGGGPNFGVPALAVIENLNLGSLYQGQGGTWYPPNLMNIGGQNGAPYGDGIFASPGPLRQFLEVQPNAVQLADPNYKLSVLTTGTMNGYFSLFTNPHSDAAYLYAYKESLLIQGDNGITLNPGTKITLAGLAAGCVQAGNSGLLTTTNSPCIPANIPLRFVGTITTTASGSDPLAVTGLATSNHCSAQATNAPASTLPVYVTLSTGSLSVIHPSPTSGATFDIFCNIL